MIKIKQFVRRLLVFAKLHKYSVFIVGVALFVSIFLLWDNLRSVVTFIEPSSKLKEKEEVKIEKVRAPLSGVLVNPDRAKRRPLAVVVENHSLARPQSGLDKASIVYETYAEGGITRFLVIFQENDATEIGPVRSARTEFVEWADEMKAIFAHVGGSTDALNLIGKMGILDFNQFANGSYFWRDSSRFSPHNVYTTTDKLRDGGELKGYSLEQEIVSFKFKEDAEVEELPESLEILIPFSKSTYSVKYIYDKEKNDYARFLAGIAHDDKITGEQLRAKNIIVQYTNVVNRAGLDTQVTTIGSGKIDYYIDGKKFEGIWKKTSSGARTKYLDLDGNEIVLNAGTTWIEVEKK